MRVKFLESRTYEEALKISNARIDDAKKLWDVYTKEKGDKWLVYRACPFCGNDDYSLMEKFHNRYGIARCRHCNSLYVNPCPNQEALNDYYNNYMCNSMLEDVYRKRANKSKSAILDERVLTITKYIKKIERKKIRILEVGCSNGSFLKKLQDHLDRDKSINSSFELYGVDTNGNAISSCSDPNLILYTDTAEHFLETTDLTFDIIWHAELVEHIIDPYSLFHKMYTKMNHNSYMIFTTPNDYSLEMKNISYNVPRVLACNVFPPMHLNAFSVTNVTSFVLRNDFCIEEISTPGNFDMEIFEMEKEYISDDFILSLIEFEEEQKEIYQNLIKKCGGSSHLQCVVSKR